MAELFVCCICISELAYIYVYNECLYGIKKITLQLSLLVSQKEVYTV
jgi:hypothetical protein